MPKPKVEVKLAGMDDDWIISSELAKLLNVSPSAISNWKKRHSDFPRPLFVIKQWKIYSRKEVLAWNESRITSHGGSRVPLISTMLKLIRRMPKEDQQKLKELI